MKEWSWEKDREKVVENTREDRVCNSGGVIWSWSGRV